MARQVGALQHCESLNGAVNTCVIKHPIVVESDAALCKPLKDLNAATAIDSDMILLAAAILSCGDYSQASGETKECLATQPHQC